MNDLYRPVDADGSTGYFDTASIGLVPHDVRRAVVDCYDAMGLGTRGSARWRPVTERARDGFADEFGVAPTEIGFMASTGEAFNAIAHAVPWRSGDEALVLEDDFPTVIYPWLSLGNDVAVVRVPPLPGDDRLGALLAAIGPRTRVVAVSHVSPFTGTTVDLQVLGKACAAKGALLVVDGAQAAGAVPVDMTGVDFYVATGYKWMLAGFGIALVVARHASLAKLRPSLLGHGNPPPSPTLSYGHLNLPGVYALEAAARVRRSFGLDAVRARVSELARRIHVETAELGLAPVAAIERTGGIVSLGAVPDVPGAVARLADAGLAVANRGGYLRISPYLHTSDTDVDHLLTELRAIR